MSIQYWSRSQLLCRIFGCISELNILHVMGISWNVFLDMKPTLAQKKIGWREFNLGKWPNVKDSFHAEFLMDKNVAEHRLIW